MKAFRGIDDQIRLFRPDLNMKRMNATATRASLPNFDEGELLKLLKKLLVIEKQWVPTEKNSCLYIRPTLIATEVKL